MGQASASILCRFFVALLLAFAGLTCKNQTTTQELLEANFLAKGQTPIDLLSPSENQQVTTANPTLSWSSKGVELYVVQIATDLNFTTIMLDKEVSGTSYTVSNSDLSGVRSLTTASYYWRVKIARISTNLQSKVGTFFLVAIPASGSGYAGALYVNAASTSSLQIGSKEAPYKKIQSAIGAADALRNNVTTISLDILVAKGNYTEEINLVPGISIRGGHNADDWVRNIATNTTTIQAPTDVAIRGNSAITTAFTSTTWVDGFTIQGAAAAISYGINLIGSSPTISNNTIAGGATTNSSSYGIYNSTASSPAISNNIISGCTAGGGFCYGVYNSASSPTLSNNMIFGGTTTGSGSYGIYNSASSPAISNNTINGGMIAVGTTYGIYNSSASSPAISSNTINGGVSPTSSYGISNSASSPNISNNTITSGAGTIGSVGIHMTLNSTPTIRNNIICTIGKATNRHGIYESSAGDNPIAIKNNAFFDIGTGGNFYVYNDFDSVCNGGASGGCTSIANMEIDLNAEAAGTASGNFNQNPSFANFPNKVDVTKEGADTGTTYDGTTTTLEVSDCTDYVTSESFEYERDGIARQITACSTATGSAIVTFTPALSGSSVVGREVRLWGTNNTNLVIDFHLKASSPCDVRQGGLDLSSLFTTDRDGVTRTATLTCGPANAGAAGWSIGAYEY